MENKKTLLDLLTDIRKELSGDALETADALKDMEEYVKANRSGIMSAFIKSMRMQKINQSLYWGWLLLLGRQSPWYVSRRTMISAAEDGTDVDVFEYVTKGHSSKKYTAEQVLKQAIAVCLAKNWYNCQIGRRSMQLMFKSNKLETEKVDDYDKAYELLEASLFSGSELDFMNALNIEIQISDMKEFTMDEYYARLIKMLKKRYETTKDERYMRMHTALKSCIKDIVGYNDFNWSFVVSFMLSQGFAEPTDLSDLDKYDGLIAKIRDIAEEDLKENKVKIPAWAYDGLHASNKEVGRDKRFAGTNQGFYNMILMYRANGRVDPRDAAGLENLEVEDEKRVLGNPHVEKVEM